MKVFIAVPYDAQPGAVDRIADHLRRYGHECYCPYNDGWLGEEDIDPCECDAVVLGQGWSECPLCRNVRYDAVCNGKIIAYESDLSLLDLHTLRDPNSAPRREYRTLETPDGIHVQVKGQWLGLWHTVKTFRDNSDPLYAKLLAEELIDKLTDD